MCVTAVDGRHRFGGVLMERPLPAGLAASILKDIESDVHSGATEIAQKAARCLCAFTEQGHPDAREYDVQLVELGRAIIAAQPAMAPLFNLVNKVLLDTEEPRRL